MINYTITNLTLVMKNGVTSDLIMCFITKLKQYYKAIKTQLKNNLIYLKT